MLNVPMMLLQVFLQVKLSCMEFVLPQGWLGDKGTRQQGALTSSNAVLCMQAMEYMVNCKYTQAAETSGHPVESHCVILVSL